ncbi:HAD family hydrolase [Aliiglaciecola sp. NS0011-25]|uniref:HAD family hydrolase n=1 Tax=Aliiglaciecola sp. NS0011-25 TaxID=3127654 RepID=UPI0031028B97
MNKTYLFDWGDTLMVDFPDQQGKMCNWSKVEAVAGAYETLQSIAANSTIYVATNAAESTALDIAAAFAKVGLAKFIAGYFGRFNLGVAKGSSEFYVKIAANIKQQTSNMVMVGDSLERDIIPAIEAGLEAIWLNHSNQPMPSNLTCRQIKSLDELCT